MKAVLLGFLLVVQCLLLLPMKIHAVRYHYPPMLSLPNGSTFCARLPTLNSTSHNDGSGENGGVLFVVDQSSRYWWMHNSGDAPITIRLWPLIAKNFSAPPSAGLCEARIFGYTEDIELGNNMFARTYDNFRIESYNPVGCDQKYSQYVVPTFPYSIATVGKHPPPATELVFDKVIITNVIQAEDAAVVTAVPDECIPVPTETATTSETTTPSSSLTVQESVSVTASVPVVYPPTLTAPNITACIPFSSLTMNHSLWTSSRHFSEYGLDDVLLVVDVVHRHQLVLTVWSLRGRTHQRHHEAREHVVCQSKPIYAETRQDARGRTTIIALFSSTGGSLVNQTSVDSACFPDLNGWKADVLVDSTSKRGITLNITAFEDKQVLLQNVALSESECRGEFGVTRTASLPIPSSVETPTTPPLATPAPPAPTNPMTPAPQHTFWPLLLPSSIAWSFCAPFSIYEGTTQNGRLVVDITKPAEPYRTGPGYYILQVTLRVWGPIVGTNSPPSQGLCRVAFDAKMPFNAAGQNSAEVVGIHENDIVFEPEDCNRAFSLYMVTRPTLQFKDVKSPLEADPHLYFSFLSVDGAFKEMYFAESCCTGYCYPAPVTQPHNSPPPPSPPPSQGPETIFPTTLAPSTTLPPVEVPTATVTTNPASASPHTTTAPSSSSSTVSGKGSENSSSDPTCGTACTFRIAGGVIAGCIVCIVVVVVVLRVRWFRRARTRYHQRELKRQQQAEMQPRDDSESNVATNQPNAVRGKTDVDDPKIQVEDGDEFDEIGRVEGTATDVEGVDTVSPSPVRTTVVAADTQNTLVDDAERSSNRNAEGTSPCNGDEQQGSSPSPSPVVEEREIHIDCGNVTDV